MSDLWKTLRRAIQKKRTRRRHQRGNLAAQTKDEKYKALDARRKVLSEEYKKILIPTGEYHGKPPTPPLPNTYSTIENKMIPIGNKNTDFINTSSVVSSKSDDPSNYFQGPYSQSDDSQSNNELFFGPMQMGGARRGRKRRGYGPMIAGSTHFLPPQYLGTLSMYLPRLLKSAAGIGGQRRLTRRKRRRRRRINSRRSNICR